MPPGYMLQEILSKVWMLEVQLGFQKILWKRHVLAKAAVYNL